MITGDVNLSVYQPTGWSDKIILSTQGVSETSSSVIYDNQEVYLSFAVTNYGPADIPDKIVFSSQIYVDGRVVATLDISGLLSNHYQPFNNIDIGVLSKGVHSIKLVIDSNGSINETNETDNTLTVSKTIVVAASNLTPSQLTTWDSKIVLSTQTGLNSTTAVIYSNQTVYLSCAITNIGSIDVVQSIVTKLYMDDLLIMSFNTNGLKIGYLSYIKDYNIGKLTVGKHTFKIVTDSNNDIQESDETDNQFSLTKTIN
ncbi:MAG: CARDB domain-containing protein [Bacteroidales bacterium]